tara:strand:- start:97 stop:930 length:834 start_codon:yes stop_codon:yes gene_type:complete
MTELEIRNKIWEKISLIKKGGVYPKFLNHNRVYKGAQGIYFDQKNTTKIDSAGVTVSILHTGRHYPDELSEEGLIYHYPLTKRGSRDQSEVNATKNAKKYNLPIFVILPGTSKETREVKRGWVISYNDINKTFLISFSGSQDKFEDIKKDDEFILTSNSSSNYSRSKTRPNQQKFRFSLLKNYGSKCAICDIRNEKLLIAAHIRPKDDKGSDDWRNGIVLCANHHLAFDNNLFKVNPDNLEISTDESNLKIEVNKLTTLTNIYPHKESLKWKLKNSK